MKKYVGAERDQLLLLPPDIQDWVPKDHFARLLMDLVAHLDLSSFYSYYEKDRESGKRKSLAGRPPYDPRMLLTLFYYALYKGHASSRDMEELTRSDLGARLIVGGKILPDHSIFAAFRKRHAPDMKDALAQVILLCHGAGLIDLEHVSIDSTVIKANAAKSQHADLDRVAKEYEAAKALAENYLNLADQADDEDQKKLKRKAQRAEAKAEHLEGILRFFQSLPENSVSEDPAKPRNEEVKDERRQLGETIQQQRKSLDLSQSALSVLTGIPRRRLSDYENGQRLISLVHIGPLQEVLQIAVPHLPVFSRPRKKATKSTKRLINMTDPDAYLIKRRNKPYVVGFLPQLAVCGKYQIIVGAGLALTNNDEPFLAELVRSTEALLGEKIKVVSADSGYWGEGGMQIQVLIDEGRIVLCPPRGKRLKPAPSTTTCPLAPPADKETVTKTITMMREKLDSTEGKALYDRRSAIVEPVNARIKGLMRFPKFLTRGAVSVLGEFCAFSALHNILKLVKAGFRCANIS